MGTKLGSLTQLAETPASGDKIPLVDISTGITKYVTYSDLVGTSLLITMFQGCLQRPIFKYNSTTSIRIGAAWYEHNGTAQQMLTWNSELTFTFGSAGSNANSEDLGADEWHYLYIDDSELVGATMVAGEFVNNTTAPSWSETKHGFYSGNDRCIGAFLTNSSSQIIEFWHDGGDMLQLSSSIEDRALADLDTTWVDVILTAPNFGDNTAVLVSLASLGSSAAAVLYYRKNGSSADGHRVAYGYGYLSYGYDGVMLKVITDSSQTIEIKHNLSNAAQAGAFTHGYFFPRGM